MYGQSYNVAACVGVGMVLATDKHIAAVPVVASNLGNAPADFRRKVTARNADVERQGAY